MNEATPTPGQVPTPAPAKRFSRWLMTLLKVAIAVLGIWFVLRGVSWKDSATLLEGTSIRGVTLREEVNVGVLPQEGDGVAPAVGAANGKQIVRIAFPARAIKMRVETAGGVRDVEMPVGEDIIIPGTKETLNLPREMELDASHFKKDRDQIVHEGLRSIGIRASSKWHLLLLAWVLLGIPFFITAIRWRGLMVPQGIRMPLGKCLQLTFVGQFYSIILPGVTGGDLVKIVYASRLTGSKTKSFITIILDRVIGLLALMVIAGASAGVQLMINRQQGQPLDHTIFNVFLLIVALLAAFAVGATIYFSRRLRRLAGIEWFTEHYRELSDADSSASVEHQKLERLFRLTNGGVLAAAIVGAVVLALLRWQFHLDWAMRNTPGVIVAIVLAGLAACGAAGGLLFHNMLVRRATPVMGKAIAGIIGVDDTLHVYRGHFGLLFWAFFISMVSQLSLPLSAWLSGMAFGMTAPVSSYLAYVPVAVLLASLPVSFQGIGLMDGVLFHFFVNRGTATASQAFALAQAVRFLPILWNLVGVYWVLTGQYSRKTEPEASARDHADSRLRHSATE